MANATPNISIFDFLTIKNPIVRTPSTSRIGPSTHDNFFFRPRKLMPWQEFNFSLLEEIFGGKLLTAAKQKVHNFSIPLVTMDEVVNITEKDTEDILNNWNKPIVTAALAAVDGLLHPCTWTSRSSYQSKNRRERPNSRADGGATTLCTLCEAYSPESKPKLNERLPKVYKAAVSWSSPRSLALYDQDGLLDKYKVNSTLISPIQQAYTYCVLHGCRYGCILTTNEAFIFRIRPLEKPENGMVYHSLSFSRIYLILFYVLGNFT
jgi:hypothetical protein